MDGVTVTTVDHLPASGDFQLQRFCRLQMLNGKQDDAFELGCVVVSVQTRGFCPD